MTKSKEHELKSEVKAPPAKFSIEKLRKNCMKLFNITTSTFDGAAYGLKGEYTVSDMKDIITKWQNREVK